MTYRVRFGPEVESHLISIERYIANAGSPAIAAQYVEAIVTYCGGLATFPNRARKRDDLMPGLRVAAGSAHYGERQGSTRGGYTMGGLKRRAVLAAPVALVGGVTLAHPHVARAATKTLTIWWEQGFYPAEDQALHELIAGWEKVSGTHANLTTLPPDPLNAKIVSALTSGEVPDLFYGEDATSETIPQNAWDGKLVDVSDVVVTQERAYSPTALESAKLYDNVAKKRSYYGVPFMADTLNIPVWRSLVEEAGFKASDIPNTWALNQHSCHQMQSSGQGIGTGRAR